MAYFIAVQVQFPRIAYVPLMALGSTTSSRRALVPIREGQRTAVVRLFLMRGTPTDRGSVPLRELHTFRIAGLDRVAAGRPRLALSAHFDGRRTVSARVEVEGDGVQTARLRVPLSSRAKWSRTLVVLLLLLLGGAALLFVSNGFGRGDVSGGVGAVPSGSSSGDERMDREGAPVGGDTPDETGRDGAPGGAVESPELPETPAADDEGPESAAGEDDSAAVVPGETPPQETRRDEATPTVPPAALPLTRVVYFDPNRTYLTGAAREELDALLPVLESSPDLLLTLEGHTALFGTEEGREEISRGRAEGVLAYLVERGWSPETPPEVLWRGSREPVTRDRTQQQRNRRVEIVLTRSE
jgi:outer membrane protein OmpA-like peptidoglycan-associated protein